jgi:hypothetical protein
MRHPDSRVAFFQVESVLQDVPSGHEGQAAKRTMLPLERLAEAEPFPNRVKEIPSINSPRGLVSAPKAPTIEASSRPRAVGDVRDSEVMGDRLTAGGRLTKPIGMTITVITAPRDLWDLYQASKQFTLGPDLIRIVPNMDLRLWSDSHGVFCVNDELPMKIYLDGEFRGRTIRLPHWVWGLYQADSDEQAKTRAKEREYIRQKLREQNRKIMDPNTRLKDMPHG